MNPEPGGFHQEFAEVGHRPENAQTLSKLPAYTVYTSPPIQALPERKWDLFKLRVRDSAGKGMLLEAGEVLKRATAGSRC